MEKLKQKKKRTIKTPVLEYLTPSKIFDYSTLTNTNIDDADTEYLLSIPSEEELTDTQKNRLARIYEGLQRQEKEKPKLPPRFPASESEPQTVPPRSDPETEQTIKAKKLRRVADKTYTTIEIKKILESGPDIVERIKNMATSKKPKDINLYRQLTDFFDNPKNTDYMALLEEKIKSDLENPPALPLTVAIPMSTKKIDNTNIDALLNKSQSNTLNEISTDTIRNTINDLFLKGKIDKPQFDDYQIKLKDKSNRSEEPTGTTAFRKVGIQKQIPRRIIN